MVFSQQNLDFILSNLTILTLFLHQTTIKYAEVQESSKCPDNPQLRIQGTSLIICFLH